MNRPAGCCSAPSVTSKKHVLHEAAILGSISRLLTQRAMAPLSQPDGITTTSFSRLELPSLSTQSSMNPFYSSATLSSSTSDLNSFNNTSEPLSPRLLYAQSFDRPSSARSLPSSKRFRKNMKEMTGFGTTEEEFEALPIAVRRKVC